MFGKIIGIIVNAASPVYQKFALADPVADPIEAHVDGFGAALLDGRVGYSCCACVVCLDRCGRLWMAQIFKDCAQHGAVFCIDKEGTEFGFGGQR